MVNFSASQKKQRNSSDLPISEQTSGALRQIINGGTLVNAPRPPDTYYNGWYPVRRCSFPGHAQEPRLGLSTTKTAEFRDYRVICDFCDKEKPRARLGKCEDYNGVQKCTHEVRRQTKDAGVVNKHWRYHDAHAWVDKPVLPQAANMHVHNWFREQIDCDLISLRLQSAEQKQERFKRLKRFKEQEYRAAAKAAEKLLREQQRKCSFNNPVVHEIPPLPQPPETRAADKRQSVMVPRNSRKLETPQEGSAQSSVST